MTSNSADASSNGESFAVMDCALAAIATGRGAQNLRELRDQLQTIHPGSIYYHFWGGLLRPRFDDPEYHNDFAIWAINGLRDAGLAERLAVIDPCGYSDLEVLRQDLIDVMEERLDETEMVPWAKSDDKFYFVRSQIVVFDTQIRVKDPQGLTGIMPTLSLSSIFYHFIDARRREPAGMDDFRAWLQAEFEGFDDLIQRLSRIDPFFGNLSELRNQLSEVFNEYCS
jgi:hypothetical protein